MNSFLVPSQNMLHWSEKANNNNLLKNVDSNLGFSSLDSSSHGIDSHGIDSDVCSIKIHSKLFCPTRFVMPACTET